VNGEYVKTRNFRICIKDQALKKISPKENLSGPDILGEKQGH